MMMATRQTSQRSCPPAVTALGVVVSMLILMASPVRGEAEASFVIRAGRVITVATDQPWSFEPGIIVVRNGLIEAVGTDIALPPDLPVIDLPDATVMPGLIAAATSIASRHAGDESIAGGYHAVDTYDPYDNYAMVLAGGVTTVHLNPGDHRLVTGQGAVVRLGGAMDERVLRDRSDLTINFGEAVFSPPNDVTYSAPSSADVAMPPAVRQRPNSRLGQYLAIEEALAKGVPVQFATWHVGEFVRAWRDNLPLRIQAQRGADIAGAATLVRRHDRAAYLVGGAEAHLVVDDVLAADLPLVYRVAQPISGRAKDIGFDPNALEVDVDMLSALSDVKVALAPPIGDPAQGLRLAAATAMRAGFSPRRVIESMTRIPAEVLGVADRVGSLAPGMAADLAVFGGDPVATTSHVQRVYIGGRLVFEAPKQSAVVVHAGTIWVGPDRRIIDGSILIEDGKIAAVGTSVPRPPFARFIDAGSNAFITPGFIDAHGHLGLEGDRSATPSDMSFAGLVGAPDVTDRRVARAGVTTVMVSPYKAASGGSQVTAVKTGGADRDSRVVRATAGVYFDLGAGDPMTVGPKLRKRLGAGTKYLETWQKYEKDLKEWEEKQAKGETVETKGETETVEKVEGAEDPITGTWAVTISGGPLPEAQSATMQLKLTGSDIEGYIDVAGEQAKLVATLQGKHISGHLEIDQPGVPPLELEADIVEPDHIVGIFSIQGIEIDLDATRTDKSDVEFKVVSRRKRGKDGKPLPPKVDESLEPLRSALTGHIAIIVGVRTPQQIETVLDVAKAFEVAVVLRVAVGAAVVADTIKEHNAGVIVPTTVIQRRRFLPYHEADDLSRKGIPVAFQSDGEDAARSLSLVGLHAVERGLGADAALAALTTGPSRMFKIDDRIGSLEPGKDGDLVIFSGPPFDAGSRVLRVLINGEEVR